MEALNYTNITTPAGYLTATVYGLVVAILMIVFSISAGTRIIAGEEEAGVLDLTPVAPGQPHLAGTAAGRGVRRRRARHAHRLLGRPAAHRRPGGFDSISAGRFAAMHLHLAAFAVLFGTLTYAVGAATGRRALALTTGAGFGVLAYAASGLIPQMEGLEWVRDWSPFTWLTGSAPLVNGVDAGHLAIMLALSLVSVAVGTVAFQRRDLAV